MASAPSAEFPEITADSEEGFVDLTFRIHGHKPLPDGSQSIRAAGVYKGRKLVYDVILGPTWKSGKLNTNVPIKISQGVVTYRRVGPESDAFLQVLDELYGSRLSPRAMAADTPFTAISLEGDPGDLASGPTKIKLFYETGGEDRYAELFTNIDLAARKLEFHEKDQEYRKKVVQALQGN
jgi:hypothetical protein